MCYLLDRRRGASGRPPDAHGSSGAQAVRIPHIPALLLPWPHLGQKQCCSCIDLDTIGVETAIGHRRSPARWPRPLAIRPSGRVPVAAPQGSCGVVDPRSEGVGPVVCVPGQPGRASGEDVDCVPGQPGPGYGEDVDVAVGAGFAPGERTKDPKARGWPVPAVPAVARWRGYVGRHGQSRVAKVVLIRFSPRHAHHTGQRDRRRPLAPRRWPITRSPVGSPSSRRCR